MNAAEQTRVEYSAGRVLVKASGRWRSWSPFGYGGSVEVSVELPAGSRVTATSSLGAFHCTGALGDCRLTTAGDIHVEQARAVKLITGAGDINLDLAIGEAELTTATGVVRARQIDGPASIKNSNGDILAGEITGQVSVKAANGDITIERCHASIVAKTANGDIRVGAAGRGSVVAETGMGAVELEIPDGTAAWLDLHTGYGRLDNALDDAQAPPPGADTVEVRARTGYGDITIRRYRPPARPDSDGRQTTIPRRL